MKKTLKKSFYKHRYLVIFATWLYIISFLFAASWSIKKTPASIQQTFEKYIKQNEAEFQRFFKDNSALQAILKNQNIPKKTSTLFK